jgi:hypothetical protein
MARKLLLEVESESEALKRLAFVYSKLGEHRNAVNAYQKYRATDYDTDRTDWHLLMFYLAAQPEYAAEYRVLLKTISRNAQHTYAAQARKLEAY